MNYGIQMYSLRDLTETDLEAGLRAVAEMGYKEVEFAGYFGHSAEEVKAMLDKYGLRCSGTHTKLRFLTEDFEGQVNFLKTIGCNKYVIPSHSLNSKEDVDNFVAKCNEYSPLLKEHGIELGFHNHAKEFEPMEDGTIIHRELEARTDLFFELDTYWVYVAGLDPIEEMERLGSRVKMIHLKDGDPDGDGCSLGDGSAPVAAVCAKAIEMGCDIVVESEGLYPTGPEEVKRCIEYLNTLGH
ncbi:MAG: sugar phosphate isomerase/epimerase [Ruminococcaceae bacterium]|nr:sugar phosphate isomerase/epimerase [Oscillospiraceae bacterium]